MPGTLLYDLSNVQISSTNLLGCETVAVDQGKRTVRSNNDGIAGTGAVDKTVHYADAVLTGQDPEEFATICGLFEASGAVAGLTCIAEGRVANAANHNRITMNRMMLLGATLDFVQGSHARTVFNLANSASSASTQSSDEIAITNVASPTIAVSANARGYRLTNAVFNDGANKTPLGIMGMSLQISYRHERIHGDAEFGEIVDVGGYEVTGRLQFRDVTLSTGQTIGQVLSDAGSGYIDFTWKQSQTGTDKVLRVGNVMMHDDSLNLISRRFHTNEVMFSVFGVSGSTQYALATGSDKILTVDPT